MPFRSRARIRRRRAVRSRQSSSGALMVLHRSLELLGAPLARAPHHVLGRHAQRRLVAQDAQPGQLDEVAEPALDARLDGVFERGGDLRRVRREDHPQQPDAEVGAVDALAGAGEEQLFEHVPDVLLVVCGGGAPALREAEREVYVHHDPFTRNWVRTTLGEPCGICSALWQRPELERSSTGWPLTLTRVAAVTHCTFTHGCDFVTVPICTVNGQPETVQRSDCKTAYCPPTLTRVFEVVALTEPECGHMTVAPASRMYSAI